MELSQLITDVLEEEIILPITRSETISLNPNWFKQPVLSFNVDELVDRMKRMVKAYVFQACKVIVECIRDVYYDQPIKAELMIASAVIKEDANGYTFVILDGNQRTNLYASSQLQILITRIAAEIPLQFRSLWQTPTITIPYKKSSTDEITIEPGYEFSAGVELGSFKL